MVYRDGNRDAKRSDLWPSRFPARDRRASRAPTSSGIFLSPEIRRGGREFVAGRARSRAGQRARDRALHRPRRLDKARGGARRPRAGASSSSATTRASGASSRATAASRWTRPATASSPASTGRRGRSAARCAILDRVASSASRCAPASTRASASCTRARSPGSRSTSARASRRAAPGEVLVSQTVKDLVAGSGIAFEERGEHELKGVPGGGGSTLCVLAVNRDALIVDAVRIPIGKRNGTLASVRGDELAGAGAERARRAARRRPGRGRGRRRWAASPRSASRRWNIGRMVPLVAGWPETVAGTTVDRQCGSSMQEELQRGGSDLVRAARPRRLGGRRDDVARADGVERRTDLSDKLLERWQIVPQGISAEAIAEEWGLSREELDEYSLESHRRAIRDRQGALRERDRPRRGAEPTRGHAVRGRRDAASGDLAEALAGLQPAFLPEGNVTAGNSSQICDGAAAMLVASSARPRASGSSRGRGSSPSGWPASTRIGCCTAIRRRAACLERAGSAGTTSR